jgi:hypothetical protein
MVQQPPVADLPRTRAQMMFCEGPALVEEGSSRGQAYQASQAFKMHHTGDIGWKNPRSGRQIHLFGDNIDLQGRF